MATFGRANTFESLWHRHCAYRSGKHSQEKTAMQLEKATRVLKRVWKVVVWAELVVVAALLLYFSQFFSYDVFVSNFYQQASAATSVQRQ
jgi:hypothetical protein